MNKAPNFLYKSDSESIQKGPQNEIPGCKGFFFPCRDQFVCRIPFGVKTVCDKLHNLRTGPTFVAAHTFCASQDTYVFYGGAY